MKYLLAVITLWLISLIFPNKIAAIYNPLEVPNNRIGVHILDPVEIEEAAKFVNNDNQAQWGYVTLPIQATDRDREKWLKFMKKARKLKIIPIIRIATFGEGKTWVKPDDAELTDFANFLNDLPWPTKNRYVVIFNEVNRADEYGGSLSPEHYADVLNTAIDIFKSRSDKFFIMPAGLDNATPNSKSFMRWDTYLTRMYRHNKEIFNKIDGWASHAYPNPGFRSAAFATGVNKIDSFKYDLELLSRFTAKKLPVFITETGWSSKHVLPDTIADMYSYAFAHIWSNDQVVAVTPFLLRAGAPPFEQFSLIGKDNQSSLAYKAIQAFATKGEPQLEPEPSLIPTKPLEVPNTISLIQGASNTRPKHQVSILQKIIDFFSNIFKKQPNAMAVADKTYKIEIVTSPQAQAIGLAKYNFLPTDQAMLFPFNPPKIAHFWMKNMNFDIDIVWIKDGQVTGVVPAYYKQPEKILTSPGLVDYVLEVNINSGIKVGDRVILK